jgi:mono/diheme cytochrome c family protein
MRARMNAKHMLCGRYVGALLCAMLFVAFSALAQAGNGEKGVVNFLTPINPDPVLQHSKEIYVLSGCAYCHGVDLKVRNGEAADLLHSGIVGADVNGNLLAPLLHTGIPQTAKLSPMPQFSDLSDREIADIVQWIHYARQEGRYKEIMDAKDADTGDALAGKAYFDKNCSSCHVSASDLANVVKNYDAAGMKAHVIRPALLDAAQSWNDSQQRDAKTAAGRARHQALLENYTAPDVANLLAYLQSVK